MSIASEQIDVSVLIPTYNEMRFVGECVERMRAQNFNGSVEFLFIDGGSDDGTREFLEELGREDDRVHLLDNPARWTPHALNVGLAAAHGEFVARMDAHTFYPPGYLAAGVDRLRRGGVEWVTGPCLPLGSGRWSQRVALGMESPIGIGAATFRKLRDAEIEVDTGFTGLLRRETLRALGGWDEGWPINQDGELAGRVRSRGGRIVCLPEMAAGLVTRDSPRALARQYLRYGFYRVKTSRRHPGTLRRTHLLPPMLVVVLLSAASGRGPSRATRLAAGLYLLALMVAAGRMRRQADALDVVTLPLVWSIMHVAWGTGFVAGCARMGFPLAAVRRCLQPGARLVGMSGPTTPPSPQVSRARPLSKRLKAATSRNAAMDNPAAVTTTTARG
jgi:succinoglycan biosynthesis protein ExoA